MSDEVNEIKEAFNEQEDAAERTVVEERDVTAVDEWFAARRINPEHLHEYADAKALLFTRRVMATGMLDENELASRLCAAFQLGFEVAAKRYMKEGMPPEGGERPDSLE